jgi:hypothetical protein
MPVETLREIVIPNLGSSGLGVVLSGNSPVVATEVDAGTFVTIT